MLANTVMEQITNLPVTVINEYNQCIIASQIKIQEITEQLQYSNNNMAEKNTAIFSLPILRMYPIGVYYDNLMLELLLYYVLITDFDTHKIFS